MKTSFDLHTNRRLKIHVWADDAFKPKFITLLFVSSNFIIFPGIVLMIHNKFLSYFVIIFEYMIQGMSHRLEYLLRKYSVINTTYFLQDNGKESRLQRGNLEDKVEQRRLENFGYCQGKKHDPQAYTPFCAVFF